MNQGMKFGELHDVARPTWSIRTVRWLAAALVIALSASLAGAQIRASSFCPASPAGFCNLIPGHRPGVYQTTSTGGVLKAATFAAFPFPAGIQTTLHIPIPDANCVAPMVIPYPGGFSVPVFCVAALGYTVQVAQNGCGVGVVDTDGGSDLTLNENGDTSYNLNGCAAHQACGSFVDSTGDIDITVGDGIPDTCSSGTGNAMVSIPVETLTWLSANGCPDTDEQPNQADDTLIAQFTQTLDLTTDRAVAQFNDNDLDGCSLKGVGPAGPYLRNVICVGPGNPYSCCTGSGSGTCTGNGAVGTCVDVSAGTFAFTVVGAGTIFSLGAPLHDLLYETVQNNYYRFVECAPMPTCDPPPVINFNGLAHRCVTEP